MKNGSLASYRAAAMPPERDDDDGPGPSGPPTWFAAEWLQGVVLVSRDFSRASHAAPYEAAKRWAAVMARRHGAAWLVLGWDRGEPDRIRVEAGAS